MSTMTLLEMTQNILSAMDSDTVTTITATEEAEQVALIIKETFERLCQDRDWAFLRTKTTLSPNDTGNGIVTCLKIPTTINKIIWLKYNKKDVEYVDPKTFQDILDGRSYQAGVVDANGYSQTKDPSYWTSFDEKYVYFDSYDSTTESNLTDSKAVIYAVSIPIWTHVDSFTPDIPEKAFSVLLADAKSTCFITLKQQANAKEEAVAKRGRARLQSEHFKLEQAELKTNSSVNYGRK